MHRTNALKQTGRCVGACFTLGWEHAVYGTVDIAAHRGSSVPWPLQLMTITPQGSAPIGRQTSVADHSPHPPPRLVLACVRLVLSMSSFPGAKHSTRRPKPLTRPARRTFVPAFGTLQAVLLSYVMYLVAALESMVVHRIVTVSRTLSNKRQCVSKYGGLLNTARCGGGGGGRGRG